MLRRENSGMDNAFLSLRYIDLLEAEVNIQIQQSNRCLPNSLLHTYLSTLEKERMINNKTIWFAFGHSRLRTASRSFPDQSKSGSDHPLDRAWVV